MVNDKIEILKSHITSGKAKVTILLNFLVFADYIILQGESETIFAEIRDILRRGTAIHKQHVREAAKLPRNLVADGCVKAYILHIHQGGDSGRRKRTFKFQREYDELEGFKADLSAAYTRVFRNRSYDDTITEPLTKKTFNPYQDSRSVAQYGGWISPGHR